MPKVKKSYRRSKKTDRRGLIVTLLILAGLAISIYIGVNASQKQTSYRSKAAGLNELSAPCTNFIYKTKWVNGGFNGQLDFDSPFGVAVSPINGHIVVADYTNNKIQEFSSDGSFYRAWGGQGVYYSPSGVIVDQAGDIYVTFQGLDQNGYYWIRKFDGDDASLIWEKNSYNHQVRERPLGLSIYNNKLYVSYFSSNQVGVWNLNGSWVTDYTPAGLAEPMGIGIFDGTGIDSISDFGYIASFNNGKVYKYDANVFDDYLLTTNLPGATGLITDKFNRVYVASRGVAPYGSKIHVYDASGNEFLKLYEIGNPGSGNGQFNQPRGIAFDPTGRNLLVADTNNHRVQQFSCIAIDQKNPGTF